MSWQPVPRRGAKKRRRRAALLILLLAVNALVILYHGDPRDQLADAERAATENAAQDGNRKPQRGASDGKLPGPAAAFDPLVGMRAPGPVKRVEVIALKRRQTPAGCLLRAGVRADDVQAAVAALQPVMDFRRMRPGDSFKARFDADDRLVSLDVHRGTVSRARARREDGGFSAERIEIVVDTVLTQLSGEVRTSLWDAVMEAGGSPALVHEIVNVFAWEIDFYTEVYTGDTFRALVEKRYAEGKLLGFGRVLAAQYQSAGSVHRGFLYQSASASAGYYDETGASLRRQLLKSPLKYGHVTSRYGNRRHPLLGYTRKHNGVDYGVPRGTPVWSVGDGRVMRVGVHGGFGKLVEVRHANGWLSQYAHLSKILVKRGQRVEQKQHVGLVGATGIATGPHLHYGLKHHGRYVNPLSQRFERGRPLRGAELDGFKSRVAELQHRLDGVRIAREPEDALAQEEG